MIAYVLSSFLRKCVLINIVVTTTFSILCSHFESFIENKLLFFFFLSSLLVLYNEKENLTGGYIS